MEESRLVARCFGQNLHLLRKKADISQENLAFGAGLHRTEIGLLERGERLPRIDTVLKLAAAVGVKVESPLLEGLEWSPGGVLRGGFLLSPSEEEEGGS